MTKRSLLLTALAVLLFLAAIISLVIEKQALVKEYEEDGAKDPTANPEPDRKPETEIIEPENET